MQADPSSPPRAGDRRTGLALGPHATVCRATGGLRPRPRAGETHPLPPPGSEEWTAALADLLGDVVSAGRRGAAVHVALLRPLAATKALRLPPVRGAALRALVARGAERWFPFAAGDAVHVVPLAAGTEDEASPTALVSAGDAAMVDALLAAAHGAGVEVAAVVPAAHAVAAAALRLAPGLARGRHLLVVPFHHATEALLLHGGELRAVRSLPFAAPGDGAGDAARRAAQLRELTRGAEGEINAPSVVLAGATDPALDDELDRLGVDVAVVGDDVSAEALAAFGATLPAARRHDLRPLAHRLPSRRAALRRTGALLAGAAALAVVAAAGHLSKLEEAGDRAAARRATLRPAVQEVLRTRAEIDSLRLRLAALERSEAARQRWLPFFDRFAAALPREAYVQSLRAEGGEVAIEGYARSASTLVLALEREPGLHDVRFTSSVQREQTAAGERERFSLRFAVPDLLPAPADSARGDR